LTLEKIIITPISLSIISVFSNLSLGILKLIFGFLTGSVSLIADGLHSGVDVFSSFITFLGLKISKKPVDKKHPYGHWKAESLAGFFVAILLGISGIWLFYEAGKRIFEKQTVELSAGAIIIVVVSFFVNEILARLKFYYGGKFKTLSLVADAEHSRADALSSIGVLLALGLVNYFSLIDSLVAFLIGSFMLYRAFQIGREITDSLLDAKNPEVEERIKKICLSHKIEISHLRTRKIGPFTLAEIKIKLPPKLKIEKVQKITETLEERLLSNIPELKEIIISIEAYNLAKITVLPKLGKKIGQLEGFEKIGVPKKGERIIFPIEKGKLALQFGAREYLVVDLKDGKILRKEIIKNPYFEKKSPHGARFAKAIRADKIITCQIGPNARQNLENFGIEIEIIPPDKEIDELLEKLKRQNGTQN